MMVACNELFINYVTRFVLGNMKPSLLCTVLASSGGTKRSGFVFPFTVRVPRLVTGKSNLLKLIFWKPRDCLIFARN